MLFDQLIGGWADIDLEVASIKIICFAFLD